MLMPLINSVQAGKRIPIPPNTSFSLENKQTQARSAQKQRHGKQTHQGCPRPNDEGIKDFLKPKKCDFDISQFQFYNLSSNSIHDFQSKLNFLHCSKQLQYVTVCMMELLQDWRLLLLSQRILPKSNPKRLSVAVDFLCF